MVAGKSAVFLLSAVILLQNIFGNSWASVTEGFGPEDDEDSFIVGTFQLTFRVNISCSESWYSDNFEPLFIQLQNSITDGIRRDCSNCAFHSYHLQEAILTCQPTEQSVLFGASIIDWVSENYPLPKILKFIEMRYNTSDEVIFIRTENFTRTDSSTALPDVLELIAMNVNTSQKIATSGSGQMDRPDLGIIDSTAEIDVSETDFTGTMLDGNNSTDGAGVGQVSSDNTPRASHLVLFLASSLVGVLILQQH